MMGKYKTNRSHANEIFPKSLIIYQIIMKNLVYGVQSYALITGNA